MNWQRARTDEQKQKRISQIIHAAEKLLEKEDFDSITLAGIARQAGFTRSNLYKYFSTKEEIFLMLADKYIHEWQQALLECPEFSRGCTIRQFSRIISSSLLEKKRTLEFISILHSQLEKNVSKEHLAKFKKSMQGVYNIFIELIAILFPEISSQKVFRFVQIIFSCSAGIYQAAEVSQLRQDVYDLPEFTRYGLDFQNHLSLVLESVLKASV